MTSLKKLAFLALFLFILQHQALAGDNPVIKFARGIENIITSPLEYFLNYDRLVKQERSAVVTTIAGTFYGTFWMCYRIVGGAVETVTFFIPLPPHYEPLLKPSTPIQALREHGYFD